MHLTFWQPIPSPHQSGLFEALASAPWVSSVRLRYESPLSIERRAQGWEDAEFVGVDVARITEGEVPQSGGDQVNIFTGFLTHSGVWRAYNQLPTNAPGLRFAYAEAPELRGFAGWSKRIKYRLAAQRLSKGLDGVLALGKLGTDFYRDLLGAKVPVFTFGYYDRLAVREKPKAEDLEFESSKTSGVSHQVSGLSSSSPQPPPMHGKIGVLPPGTRRLLFVGECIWQRGLDQLLVALAAMPPSTPSWVLDVVGVGTESYVLMQLAERLDLVDRVRFRGVVRGERLAGFYERANLVVVPSRWDGWGMAVNEALFAGVPVAASDKCGATSVIENLQRCLVLPAGKTKAWPELLSEWLEWGPASESEQTSLRTAAQKLTGEAGAEELRKTIEQARQRR